MARPDPVRPRHLGLAGLALLGVVVLVAALVVASWRSGLLTVRSGDLAMRLPEAPALPQRAPDPNPAPLPRPGPGVEGR